MKVRYVDIVQDRAHQERYINLKDMLVISLKLKNGDISYTAFVKALEDLIA